jgi:hypothetical protein
VLIDVAVEVMAGPEGLTALIIIKLEFVGLYDEQLVVTAARGGGFAATAETRETAHGRRP